MHNPLSWAYMTTPVDQADVWGPFSIAYLVIFSLGLLGSLGVVTNAGARLGRPLRVSNTIRRACAVLLPIFAVGLFFFLCRVLRVSAYNLSIRLWLYLSLAAVVAVVAYYASASVRAKVPIGRLWSRGTADGVDAHAQRVYARFAVVLFASYMAVAVALYVWRGIFFHPDRWAVLLFITALLLGQWKAFLRDWIPVVFLIFGFEFMRGMAYEFIQEQNRTVHLTELITADKTLFGGHLPVLWVHQRFYVEGTIHWYDVLAAVMYALHFVFPLLFAFLVWIGSKEHFWHFTLAFLLMTYSGFVIYLLYPAAPPWLANEWGAIEGLVFPFNQVWNALIPQPLNNFDAIQIWNGVSGNPVAAMPSLHAAYPWLTMLFAIKFFWKWGLLFIPYNVALWFSVLYLGHHWVIDVLAGIALATLSYVVMELAWPKIRGLAMRATRSRAPAPVEAVVPPVRLVDTRQREEW